MANKKGGYKVTIEDVKKVCMILYKNNQNRHHQSIEQMRIKTDLSREVFCKVLNILCLRHIVTKTGYTRNMKFLWNFEMTSPNESLYLSIHNEYYKKVQKEKAAIKKEKKESNRLTVSKCLSYLKDEGFSGEIYKIKFENGLKIKTVFFLS